MAVAWGGLPGLVLHVCAMAIGTVAVSPSTAVSPSGRTTAVRVSQLRAHAAHSEMGFGAGDGVCAAAVAIGLVRCPA
ncbi:hypothetical protein SAMN05444374_102124 [Rhodococcoides kroppenstedtii]|uniref:Uncharacterized protein n=1 Tax=Rhodococcoides kroppenstedtii TaxID=293050 RepID=A0A1I0SQF2_9NOCA|nr:hypothetical protein SAMN05444374_102124 [Rhodococcus kroppenstedtii]